MSNPRLQGTEAEAVSAYNWQVGVTRRGVYGTSDGGTHSDPLRHVFTSRPASKWGRNVLALCGTSITPHPVPNATFDPQHPRACRNCVRALREREAS